MKNFVIEPEEFKTISLGFSSCDIQSFDSIYGFILWCLIKRRCITDQHFDDTIVESAYYYERNLPDNFMDFRDNLFYPLRKYISSNDEFLLMLFRILHNPSLVTYEIDEVVYNLTKQNLKLFKPEVYI